MKVLKGFLAFVVLAGGLLWATWSADTDAMFIGGVSITISVFISMFPHELYEHRAFHSDARKVRKSAWHLIR